MTVKAIKETSTSKNIIFQDTGNHHKMALNEFVKKIESGTSIYSILNKLKVVKLQNQSQIK